jgi:hypothetical protein
METSVSLNAELRLDDTFPNKSPAEDSCLTVNLERHHEMLLRCISPNKLFIVSLCSRLSTDVTLDECTKQQLMSSTRTDYEKNEV